MNDIRLLTGKNIIPDFDTAAGLLGCRGVESKSGIKAVYETLFPLVKRYMRPKAAFLIEWAEPLSLCDTDTRKWHQPLATTSGQISEMIC